MTTIATYFGMNVLAGIVGLTAAGIATLAGAEPGAAAAVGFLAGLALHVAYGVRMAMDVFGDDDDE